MYVLDAINPEKGDKTVALILPPRTGTRSIQVVMKQIKAKRVGLRHDIPKEMPETDVIVSTIRHPCDVLVSWFFYPDKDTPGLSRFLRPNRKRPAASSAILGGDGRTFNTFIDFVLSGKQRFLTDTTLRHAELASDYIRFEKGLESELNRVLAMTGREKVRVPHVGSTKRKPWPEFYNDEQLERIGTKYKSDFERYGYDVRTPAI